MCRKTSCSTCGRPSWAGCGAHVEQVLGDVAPADRCQCKTAGRAAAAGCPPVPAGGRRGILARLLGR